MARLAGLGLAWCGLMSTAAADDLRYLRMLKCAFSATATGTWEGARPEIRTSTETGAPFTIMLDGERHTGAIVSGSGAVDVDVSSGPDGSIRLRAADGTVTTLVRDDATQVVKVIQVAAAASLGESRSPAEPDAAIRLGTCPVQ